MHDISRCLRPLRSLLLAGVCLGLCNCGGGGKSAGQSRDAGADLLADVSSSDLATFDVRLAIEAQLAVTSDASVEVQSEVQPDTFQAGRDAFLSADGIVAVATDGAAEVGVDLDLARLDGSTGSDVAPTIVDATLEVTLDQATEIRTTFEVGVDTSSLALDLGTPDATGQCNNLDDSLAPLHDEVNVDGPVPVPAGGVIADGLYFESAAELYGTGNSAGPAGSQRRMVMRIAGTAIEAAFFSTSSGDHRLESDTLGPAGADGGVGSIHLTQVCLGPSPRTALSADMGYSAVGSGVGATLKLIYPTITIPGLGSQTIVLTLIRQ